MAGKKPKKRKKKQKWVWLTVEMSKETLRKLKAIAKERKMTVARLCREIITEAIERWDAERSF